MMQQRVAYMCAVMPCGTYTSAWAWEELGDLLTKLFKTEPSVLPSPPPPPLPGLSNLDLMYVRTSLRLQISNKQRNKINHNSGQKEFIKLSEKTFFEISGWNRICRLCSYRLQPHHAVVTILLQMASKPLDLSFLFLIEGRPADVHANTWFMV